MSFHNCRLPIFMDKFLVAEPYFSTSIVRSGSGREARSADFLQQRKRLYLRDCRLSRQQFMVFSAFFQGRMGQKFSFLLCDPVDHLLVRSDIDANFAAGHHQLGILRVKYNDDIRPTIRDIRHLDPIRIKLWIDGKRFMGKYKIIDGRVCIYEQISVSSRIEIEVVYLTEARFMQDSYEYTSGDDGTILLSEIKLVEVDSHS